MATISEIRGIGPVFTTTAAVATDATVYSFDVANHDDDAAAYYFEIDGYDRQVSVAGQPILSDGGYKQFYSNTGGNSFRFRDGTNESTIADVFDTGAQKAGGVYSTSDNEMQVAMNALYGTLIPYDGSLDFGATIPVYLNSNSAGKMRELQRWDITSFADGKQIITDLMGP